MTNQFNNYHNKLIHKVWYKLIHKVWLIINFQLPQQLHAFRLYPIVSQLHSKRYKAVYQPFFVEYKFLPLKCKITHKIHFLAQPSQTC